MTTTAPKSRNCLRALARLHDVLFGAVVEDTHAHFAGVRGGEFFDADRIKGRAQPGFRVKAQVHNRIGSAFVFHDHHLPESMPGNMGG